MLNSELTDALKRLSEINFNHTINCSEIVNSIDTSSFLQCSEQIAMAGKLLSDSIAKMPKIDIDNINLAIQNLKDITSIKENYHISTRTGCSLNINYNTIPIDHRRDDDFYICQN